MRKSDDNVCCCCYFIPAWTFCLENAVVLSLAYYFLFSAVLEASGSRLIIKLDTSGLDRLLCQIIPLGEAQSSKQGAWAWFEDKGANGQ